MMMEIIIIMMEIMVMMKGCGGDSGGVGFGRTPEQPARPRGSGAGLAWGGGLRFTKKT